jgi:hypothetical protein
MNKEQFTPGPWFANKPYADKILITNEVSPSVRFICEISKGITMDNFQQRDIANANLIAAAPDMYEALKKAVFLIQGYMVAYGHGASATNELEYLKAALNKANGNQ